MVGGYKSSSCTVGVALNCATHYICLLRQVKLLFKLIIKVTLNIIAFLLLLPYFMAIYRNALVKFIQAEISVKHQGMFPSGA